MVPELKDVAYEENFKEMELPTLEERREKRGGLIDRLTSDPEETGRKYYIMKKEKKLDI